MKLYYTTVAQAQNSPTAPSNFDRISETATENYGLAALLILWIIVDKVFIPLVKKYFESQQRVNTGIVDNQAKMYAEMWEHVMDQAKEMPKVIADLHKSTEKTNEAMRQFVQEHQRSNENVIQTQRLILEELKKLRDKQY